ncbi:hypothetical protein MtrunA17_Chr8g0370741 [Medicago truncatula]|uniref:Uncharacterized protein n=1 Tax=Medicago truncatula TaxID=3880 RepID=A0A396GLH5_MEDTR|nr:hypothetical protein MtrunA17_Chr8g0370741 [Medicago truncatula]
MKLGPVFLGPKTGYNNADHIANGFLSAIFRPDTFDPALLWRGRLDRIVEFGFLT